MILTGGVDVINDIIDLQFRVTVLEKIVQRLLENAMVSAGLTQSDIHELWDQTFKELQGRYPDVDLKMTPPPPELTEFLGDRSKHTRFSLGWTCPNCRWQGISVVMARKLNPGETADTATIRCPNCDQETPLGGGLPPPGFRVLRAFARPKT
jgi:hypothetical protein